MFAPKFGKTATKFVHLQCRIYLTNQHNGNMRQLLTTILLTTVVLTTFADAFKPIATNFTTADYGSSAGVQNWSCTQGPNSEMYFGNNRGMLYYDGYHWQLYSLPEEVIARSVYAEGDSIFVGSYEEFGYFKHRKDGTLKYHSLRNKVKNFVMDNEEIWNIMRHNGRLIFQSFKSAFIWDGHNIEIVSHKNQQPLYFHKINNKIYAQIINGDYCIFDGKNYQKVFDRQQFGDDNIVAAIQLAKGRAVLCSDHHGLFMLDKANNITKFDTEADQQLAHGQVNRAIMTQDSTLIIGTILDGIYALDLKGKLLWHYSTQSGILNNSVLGLFCDRDNNIWAALDNGIALIHTGAPYSILIPERGETMLGMIYAMALTDRRAYIATNQGLYQHDGSRLSLIEGTGGQNWHVTVLGRQVFVGNNLATLEIDAETDKLQKLPGTASSTCMQRCRINEQNVIIESSYSELRIYRYNNGKWALSNLVEGFAAPVNALEIEQSGAIWASNMNRGAYRIELSRDLRKVTNLKYYKNAADSGTTIKHIMKVRGRIVFSDNKRLYTYDDLNQQIIPYNDLNAGLNNTADIHSATPIDDRTFWLSGKNGYYLVAYKGNKFVTTRYIPISFFGLQNNESNDHVYFHNNISYFNMNNGIARFDSKRYSETKWNLPQLRLDRVTYTSKYGETSLLNVDSSKKERVKTPGKGSINFQFCFPNYNNEPINFRYELTGNRETVTTSTSPDISLHDLSFGNYQLKAIVTNSDNTVIGEYIYYFSIPTPFFLSAGAIISYILLIITAIYFFSKWQTRRALEKRNAEYEAEKNKQNIKMLEQEKLINQQQQQLLEAELSAKSKEIASLALDMFAKEKVIESLKESMIAQRQKGDISSRDMDALLKKVESNMGNLEFLDIYQKNFDLIHDQFFRKLRERYPSLTASDLKFCALLRLNLSTKDIAKFTNLTVRGVEAARYRLRKKLNLPEKTSLIEFLIDFK